MAEEYEKSALAVAAPDQEPRTGPGHQHGNIYAIGDAVLHLGDGQNVHREDPATKAEEQARQKQKQRHGQ